MSDRIRSAGPGPLLQPSPTATDSVIPNDPGVSGDGFLHKLGDGDFFDKVRNRFQAQMGRIDALKDRFFDRPFATGHDGFVAVDKDGGFGRGMEPSARVRDRDLPNIGIDGAAELLAKAEPRKVTFSLPGGRTVEGMTDDRGHAPLPYSSLKDLSKGMDPKRGAIASVNIATPNGESGTASVLMLPADYDGPIFISDIDDTLRHTQVGKLIAGERTPPIPGSAETLKQAADLGIPIIYLSAGVDRMRNYNRDFLSQLPAGVLLDRDEIDIKDVDPRNHEQTRRQGNYKAQVLGELRQTFPKAQLFGFGDDKFGDANAYTRQSVNAYIHDVKPGDDNIPADFTGTQVANYDEKFIAKVGADLKQAVERSASFGGTPGAPADPNLVLSAKLDKLTGTKPSEGNDIDLLVDGEQARPKIFAAIDNAKRSICYETFEFHDDELGNEMADKLIAASQRGVKVRVLADAFGSREMPLLHNKVIARMREAGVDIRIYNPLDEISDITDISRNHRKSITVDGSLAFVGGMNTGDEYMGDREDVKEGWRHDLFTQFQGPAVKDAAKNFADSWAASGGRAIPDEDLMGDKAPREDGVKMRVVAHVPKEGEIIRAAYLAMIDSAKDHINVENSFPMTYDLVDALAAAAERGVRVRYFVGSDEGLLGIAAKKNYKRLLDAGVEIHVYPTKIHSKALSVDGRMASVGSSNVDNVALQRNREIVAIVEDPKWVADFETRVFDKDLEGPGGDLKTRQLKNIEGSRLERLRDGAIAAVWPDTIE